MKEKSNPAFDFKKLVPAGSLSIHHSGLNGPCGFSAKAYGSLPHFNYQLKLAAINGCHKQDKLPLALANGKNL